MCVCVCVCVCLCVCVCVCVCVLFIFTPFSVSIICVSQEEPSLIAANHDLQVSNF